MVRHKGTKNKPRIGKTLHETKKADVDEEPAELEEPEEKVEEEEVEKEVKPVEVEEVPLNSSGCKGCGHTLAYHYKSGGSKTNWCNHPGCECLDYQS